MNTNASCLYIPSSGLEMLTEAVLGGSSSSHSDWVNIALISSQSIVMRLSDILTARTEQKTTLI